MAAGRPRLGVAERLRRCADRLIAALLLVIFSPLMLACAALIRRDGGPATFAHYRVGSRGRVFRCFKFRTMCVDAERKLREVLDSDPALREEWERTFKLANDPRVTPIGRWLRRSSLDELPQLLNVIGGDMSLVGPRPLRPFEVGSLEPWQLARQDLRPGLTGLWQVLGRSTIGWEERMQLDYDYVSHWSFASDLRILLRTLPAVLRRDGAI